MCTCRKSSCVRAEVKKKFVCAHRKSLCVRPGSQKHRVSVEKITICTCNKLEALCVRAECQKCAEIRNSVSESRKHRNVESQKHCV